MTLDHCHGTGTTGSEGRLGLYMAADGEISPDGIGSGFAALGWSIWIPVVDSGTGMTFGRLEPDVPMVENRFGILEPDPSAERREAAQLDIVIVPCVAIDRDGNRMGMGAGFYDRALSPVHPLSGSAGVDRGRPLLIGVGFDFQLVDRIDPDPWDVPMDVVVTDRRVLVPPPGPDRR